MPCLDVIANDILELDTGKEWSVRRQCPIPLSYLTLLGQASLAPCNTHTSQSYSKVRYMRVLEFERNKSTLHYSIV